MLWKKRILILAVCVALLAGVLAIPAAAFYEDVDTDAWYYNDILWGTRRALYRDYTDSRFGPDTIGTRGEVATVLCRMAGAQDIEWPDGGFEDVPAWCANAVNWGKNQGIIRGISDTAFAPGASITRQDLCTLILRYAKVAGFTLPVYAAHRDFVDADQIADYAAEAVDICQMAGYVQGDETGAFRPQDRSTRAEIAAVLTRFGWSMEQKEYQIGLPPVDTDDWHLMLVNPWNSIPDGYVESLSLQNIGNGQRVDSRIYDDLMDMMAAMRAAGLSPYVNSAFRTHAYQQMLYSNKVSQYRGYGYGYSDAQSLAAKWVAVPGTSEHEIGLAIDFNMYMSNSYSVHTWLQNYGWQYGFIYRYPANKTDVTGINPEPWHFRYVGRWYAEMIYNSGLVLEEFLAQYR